MPNKTFICYPSIQMIIIKVVVIKMIMFLVHMEHLLYLKQHFYINLILYKNLIKQELYNVLNPYVGVIKMNILFYYFHNTERCTSCNVM